MCVVSSNCAQIWHDAGGGRVLFGYLRDIIDNFYLFILCEEDVWL